MAFDASIFNQSGKPTIALQDPNELLKRTADAAAAVNANRLFQSRVAAGQALQQATDPVTGRVDPLAYQRGAAGDPNAALAMGDVADRGQALAGNQQGLGTAQNAAFGQAVGAVLNLPDNQLHPGSEAAIQRLVDTGAIPAPLGDKLRERLATLQPAELRQQLRQIQLGGQAPGPQQDQIYGTAGTIDDGGVVRPTVQQSAARGGELNQAPGAIQRQMGPGERISPVTVPLPGGREGVVTKEQFGNQATGGVPQPGNVPPMRPVAAGATASPAAGDTPPPAVAPGAPGLTPFVRQSDAAGQAQKGAVDNYNQAVRDSVGYTQRVASLDRAAEALNDAKTGNGSQALQTIASRIQTLTPNALEGILPNIRTPDQIAAFDEAKKYLTKIQLGQPGAGRSDAGLSTAGASSPSVEISPQAAKLLVQAQLGQERMQQAQLMEFHAQHPQGQEDQFGRYAAEQAPRLDPRAFVADRQTQAQRKAVLDGLTDPASKAHYLESYALAKKHGLVGALRQ